MAQGPRLRLTRRGPECSRGVPFIVVYMAQTHINSEASPVDTNNQPAKNSEGRVIEWITQYLRDEWSRARSSSRSSNPEEWTSYGSGRSLTALRTRTSVCSAKGYQTSSSGQVAIRSAHIRAVVKSTCRGLRLSAFGNSGDSTAGDLTGEA